MVSKGDRVAGKYFGESFSGVVKEVWHWHGWQKGHDNVFVKLDKPVVVHGESRDSLCVSSPKSGYVRKEG
jgi:hypothetical protein